MDRFLHIHSLPPNVATSMRQRLRSRLPKELFKLFARRSFLGPQNPPGLCCAIAPLSGAASSLDRYSIALLGFPFL
jgi:hypothetical protein